ncbi:MAG TPA: hypothetical protein VF085_01450 [Solirubrobacterales bacterium]
MNAMVIAGASAELPTEPLKPAKPAGTQEGWSDKIKAIGGLVAVAFGVLAVAIIAIVAVAEGTSTASTIAGSTSGVIATIVGAYFGVKVGTDQGKTAMENQKAEAAKAQVFAAHLPAEQAKDVLELSKKAAQDALGK